MRLYLLEKEMQYEGSDTIGVFCTLAKAKAAATKLCEKAGQDITYYDWVRITHLKADEIGQGRHGAWVSDVHTSSGKGGKAIASIVGWSKVGGK